MRKDILEFLELAEQQNPKKEAYEDSERVVTYEETLTSAKKIGTSLANLVQKQREPIAVYIDKNVKAVLSFWGIISSGNFYCPLDTKMPKDRIETIINVLQPKVLITDQKNLKKAQEIFKDTTILVLEEVLQGSIDEELLKKRREQMTMFDPLYVLFTSGSTGIPKGVLVPQRVIVNYFEWLEKNFSYNNKDVFANQAPFYFDVSVHDIFGAAYFGAKMVIIPKMMFSFPAKLIGYMNEKRVTTFLWVPSAMGIIAMLKAFRAEIPKYLRHAMFAGEVLPRKHLDYWVEYLPNVVYANLYGPTETFVCTGYIYNGKEPEGEPLPIGRAVANSQILVIDDEGKEAAFGEPGELCMRGMCLALGYYNDKNRTEQAFTQNPLHERYPDQVYHTGDLVRYDQNGDLIYISRKDYQIKHMGYRIELGEIETAGNQIEGLDSCACVYDDKRKKIVFFYDGREMEKQDIISELEKKVPQYMIPGKVVYLSHIPFNANGKINRKQLKEMV